MCLQKSKQMMPMLCENTAEHCQRRVPQSFVMRSCRHSHPKAENMVDWLLPERRRAITQ